MSNARYPDNRYPRDRSPYRDRRPSTYGSAYPPRANETNPRPNGDQGAFASRDPPRGPKNHADPPRGPVAGAPPGPPSAPRDDRARGFVARNEAPSLRDAPPLSSVAHPQHHPHNSWRADRDRGRDFIDRDRRDRRPSPPRRSPIRDARDQRDFAPRDLDISRARRNSRDGPPSAGSTYSDPPLVAGSSYRGSGIGRGRGGRDFHNTMRGRDRNFHNDERDRHHDARDRIPDRSYRPRSRSRDPVRRERDVRDVRDDRDFDRRDRDDRRFVPREYDSYIGPAGAGKPGPRGLDTHRGSIASDSRHMPGTPTGAAPHLAHHSPADRLGPSQDPFPRRQSVVVEPTSAKREPERNDLLLASRVEASRERYAPRASSPPAAVPAFGYPSNVWRNPALIDAKASTASQLSKPVPSTPVPAPTPHVAPASSTPAVAPPAVPAAPKTTMIPGLSAAPPTGPKADRAPEKPHADAQNQNGTQESRPAPVEQARVDPRPPVPPPAPAQQGPDGHGPESKHPAPMPMPNVAYPPANSPPQGPAARNRPPPTGPQAGHRPNVSPSFPRPAHLPYGPRDAPPDSSPGALPPMGARNNGMGGLPLSANTSPTSLPANIPTGPKAARAGAMPSRPSQMYPPDRSGFAAPRMPLGVAPKSNQWVRPGLNLNSRPNVSLKREFPMDERDRSFGSAPKAPKLESNVQGTEMFRSAPAKSTSPTVSRQTTEAAPQRARATSTDGRRHASPKPEPIQTRRLSDVQMVDASPRVEKPPVSATSSAPEVMQDSDDDLDLDDDDFAESEAKYNREKALLEAKRIDLSAANLRATTPLSEIMLLASLTIDHLPRQPTKSVDEERVSEPSVQPLPESVAAELPTPKAEEPEDTMMEDKDEPQLAPATRALRLRQGTCDELDEEPDLSSLPYLGSGPPTPISQMEGPRMNESVMDAIRHKLRQTIEPELGPEQTLEKYAETYRQWRIHVRELDKNNDDDESDRQPSAEPSMRVTTPDVTTAAAGSLLDLPVTTTGRRGHSGRWATELDFEHVLKESLKTAEEERMGKRDKEPTRSLADPEKEASIPVQLTPNEVQRRRFIDTNFQREPGQGLFVFHYEPPEDDFSLEEHRIMVSHYRDQYAKKWGKLAESLYKEAGTSRTYKDCINHYYATKWGREYKGKLKRGRGGRKRGGAGRGRGGAIANMERAENQGEDGLPPALTETGRPRRSAAPTFGTEIDLDANNSTPTLGRVRRQTDTDGAPEKRKGKAVKEKVGRKPKAQQVPVSVPAGSPIKIDRKGLNVKMEDEFGKHPLGEMPLPMQPGMMEDTMVFAADSPYPPGLVPSVSDRPRAQPASRPGPSSYWSVTEQTDFTKNVAHFGTDWAAIAMHMGTKTQTMVKNQYLRLVEGGSQPELQRMADEADNKRHRGEDLGPPPTPTPAPKRRYESTSGSMPRTLAPTPEVTIPPAMALPKASTPGTNPSRYSNIAQAPQESKSAFQVPDPALASVPSIQQQQQREQQQQQQKQREQQQREQQQREQQQQQQREQQQREQQQREQQQREQQQREQQQREQQQREQQLQQQTQLQQSPPAQPPRGPSHHVQQLPQADVRRNGPPVGYFSQDFPQRRAASQSGNMPPTSRPLQPQVQPQLRTHEQPPFFRQSHQEREALARAEQQQEHDVQMRLQAQHARRISGEASHGRQFPPSTTGGIAPMRSGQGAGSPVQRPVSVQYRAGQQPTQQPSNASTLPSSTLPSTQQLPPRSAMSTPPVKEERRYPVPVPHATMASQAQPYPTPAHPPAQAAPPQPAPKPAVEPRKSNLLSLLNDTEPEEPRRKKPVEPTAPSHTPTPQPQQQVSIPPPPPVSQAMGPQRDAYRETAISQAPFSRPPYGQQALPQNRQVVDLTSEQASGRGPAREGWRQQFTGQGQPQPAPAHNSPRAGLAQLGNHRAVFAPHNNQRYNPSPPPAYGNSPNMHSRTPSISGAAAQAARHGMSASAAAQHAAQTGTSQILQPNPYAQVDPAGSGAQSVGPVGMQPSPHLHMAHLASQREQLNSRNEQARAHNGGVPFSNPQTPSEHHASNQHMRGQSITDYRREISHDYDARATAERDLGREIAHRSDQMREPFRAGQPHSHIVDARYQQQQQERGYPSHRSQTPQSRNDHAQPPPLQHPPHSSLGDSHPLYIQRQDDAHHRFRDVTYPRDSRISDRMREEHAAQQHAGMSREDPYGRERDMRERELRERELREREMRERETQLRDAQYRESLMRGGPPHPPGPRPDGRGPPTQPMEWTRHPPQQERWNR